MADTLQFDLVSPERSLASLEVTEVQIPGSEGDMTAMAGHAPTITTLRPGILRIVSAEGTQSFAVTGGFAEITAAATSVLAERAMPADAVTAEMMAEMKVEAEKFAEGATGETRDVADKLVAEMSELAGALSL
jgi:F-type H+-transporting ATPase subunit epsilon